MLKRVNFTGFKSLHDLSIPVEPFTVLIGPNGVGKSTVLDGISYLLQLSSAVPQAIDLKYGPIQQIFDGDDSLTSILSHGSRGSLNIEVEAIGEKQFGFALLCSKETKQEDSAWRLGSVSYYTRMEGQEDAITLPSNQNVYNLLGNTFPKQLANFVRLRLDANQIKEPSPAADGVPKMRYDGFGLPSLINHIIGRRDGSIEKIEAAMGRLVHGFKRIYPEERKLEWYENITMTVDGQILYRRDKKTQNGFSFTVDIGSGKVSAAHLSEGTLLALAILTLMYSPKRPQLILLDDIDRGLHPQAQLELVGLLKELLLNEKELQIIATAHADTVVLGCAPQEVIRLGYAKDGYTEIVDVIGDPRWMTPGEITSAWFGIRRTGLDDLIQQYEILAGDPCRSEEEETKVQDLALLWVKPFPNGIDDFPCAVGSVTIDNDDFVASDLDAGDCAVWVYHQMVFQNSAFLNSHFWWFQKGLRLTPFIRTNTSKKQINQH